MAKTTSAKNNKPSKAKDKYKDDSRVMEILRKEYAFENWVLAILSPILILYGVYIVMGSFGDVTLSNLGSTGIGFIDYFFLTTLRRVLTGSFLILIGVLVLIYLMIPYVRPSLTELKKVTWPSSRTLANNSLRVFAFLILLSLIFVLFGLGFDPLFEWLYSL